MVVKHLHINIIIILCLILGCGGGDKPTTPTQTTSENTYIPGQHYGDTLGHIDYLVGNTPVIITVPHDGILTPSSISDRTYGAMSRDLNTQKVAERFAFFFVQRSGGLFPHVIVSNLHRTKLDPNRDIEEAAQGDLGAIQAYNAYHSFIQTAIDSVETYFDSGILLDLHGHGHDIQRLELGYLLEPNDLDLGNIQISSSTYIEKSSISQIASLSPANFSEVLRGPTSFGGLMVTKSYSYSSAGSGTDVYTFDAVPSTTTASPGTDPYFTGGYTTVKYSIGEINVIQIEANYDRARDTARSYGALGSAIEEALFDFYREHTGTPIY
jgi:N-formylglutamate amidohydrolase